MHTIDGLLERFEVSRDGHDIPVQSTNLKLMVFEVAGHRLLPCHSLHVLGECHNVELLPDLDHALVPTDEFLLQFLPQRIYAFLDM